MPRKELAPLSLAVSGRLAAVVLFSVVWLVGACECLPPLLAADSANSHSFRELNFRISGLGPDWTLIPTPSDVSPDATAVFRAGNRRLVVTAETIAPGLAITAGEIQQNQIKQLSGNSLVKARDDSTAKYGGIEFRVTHAVNTLPLVGQMSYHAVAVHQGYCYQLTLESERLTDEKARALRDAVFGSFELIDPNGVAQYVAKNPTKDFRSRHFGYVTNFKGSAWGKNAEVNQLFPYSDFGTSIGSHAVSIIIPVDLPAEELTAADVHKALMLVLGVSDPADAEPISGKPYSVAGMTGIEIDTIKASSQGQEYRYLIRIVADRQRAILMTAWTLASAPEAAKVLRDGLSRYTIHPNVEATPPPTDGRSKNRQAEFTNWIGVAVHRRGDLNLAARLFEASWRLIPENQVYVSNAILALTDGARYSEALAVLDQHRTQQKQLNDEMSAQRAWLLSMDSRNDEALAEFERVFRGDYRNDNYFAAYINLLLDMQQSSAACARVAAYRDKGDSQRLVALHCQALSMDGKGLEALELLNAKEKAGVLGLELEYAYTDVLGELDRHEESLVRLNGIIAKIGVTPEALSRKSICEIALGKHQAARDTLEQAIELSPNDESLRRALVQLGGLMGKGDSASLRTEIAPVPREMGREFSPSDLKSFSHVPNEVGATYLQRHIAWSMQPENPFRQTTYLEVLIHDRRGIEAFSSLQLPLDVLHERMFVNQLRVLDDQGNTVYEGKVDDYHVSDEQSDVASYDQVVTIPVSGLTPKGRLICVVTTEDLRKSNSIPFQQLVFTSTFPAVDMSLTVHADPERLRILKSGDLTQDIADQVTTIRATNIPGFLWEPDQPDLLSFVPNVVLSDAKSTWQSVGDEYLAMIEHRLNQQEDVRELAERLTANCKSDADKIEVLSKYVQESVTYHALEFGRRSHVMELPKTVLENKYGDCKDHSLLLHDLLQVVGIPCRLALVNSASDLVRDLPALDQFDHMIVCVLADKRASFVDCTAKYGVPSSELWGVAGRQALVLTKGKSRLVDIAVPATSAPDMFAKRSIEVRKNVFQVHEELELRYRLASGFRSLLASTQGETSKSVLQSMLSQIEPKIQLQEVQLENLEDFKQPLKLKVSYILPHAIGPSSRDATGQAPIVWEKYLFGVAYVDQRISPFTRRFPLRYHAESRLVGSEGIEIRIDPGEQSSKGDFVAWRVKTGAQSSATLVTVDAKRLSGTHPAERYRESYEESLEFEGATNVRFSVRGPSQ